MNIILMFSLLDVWDSQLTRKKVSNIAIARIADRWSDLLLAGISRR